MEQRINIAELLKDCQSGMELNCTICDNVYFDEVTPDMIKCYIKNDTTYNSIYFHKDGSYLTCGKAKCVIFPKGKTTWEGFQRPFKDGEVVVYDGSYNSGNVQICIFKDKKEYNTLSTCYLMLEGDKLYLEEDVYYVTRLANEKEKQRLFDAIKENGYKWNTESKTLEKLIEPKFKVGDKIVKRNSISNLRIVSGVSSEYYWLKLHNRGEDIGALPVSKQDDWELVPNKFDITTLKPFDKVLVRCNSLEKWHIQFFEKYNTEPSAKYPFICLCNSKYCQCIPFKGNEHLLGKTDNCDDYYKTWEE